MGTQQTAKYATFSMTDAIVKLRELKSQLIVLRKESKKSRKPKYTLQINRLTRYVAMLMNLRDLVRGIPKSIR